MPGLKGLQIRMASKHDSKEIPSFALIPDRGLADTRLGLKNTRDTNRHHGKHQWH